MNTKLIYNLKDRDDMIKRLTLDIENNQKE